jgi:hypothetical protein
MKRRLLNLLTALSLLLCTAAVALWVWSYLVSETCRRTNFRLVEHAGGTTVAENYREVQLHRGVLSLAEFTNQTLRSQTRGEVEEARRLSPQMFGPGRTRWERWARPASVPVSPRSSAPLLGLGYLSQVGKGGATTFRCLFLPWPLFVAATASLPCLRLARHLRAGHRLRLGRCPRCGYDLTGNTSGVCPECGEPSSPMV